MIAYENRIAVEYFHSLTDGNGALVFLKSLTAEYLEQKYRVSIPFENGVLDRRELPKEEELEDSFLISTDDIGIHIMWIGRNKDIRTIYSKQTQTFV